MGLAEHPERRSAHTLAQLQLAMELQRQVPILSLRQVMHKLHLLDEATLAVLEWEDPELLRSRSRVLVERLLITDEEWHRAMAIVAGLVEIDVATFSIDPRALDLLPLQKAMLHRVVPLGMLHDLFLVASSKPTSVDLLHELVSATGHSVAMVWASADDIDRRLALLSKASGVASPPVAEPTPPGSQDAAAAPTGHGAGRAGSVGHAGGGGHPRCRRNGGHQRKLRRGQAGQSHHRRGAAHEHLGHPHRVEPGR